MKLTAETTVFDENAVQNKFSELVVDQDGIRTEVSKKVGNDEVISRINQSAESVKIQAQRVEVDGTLIVGKSAVDTAKADAISTASDDATAKANNAAKTATDYLVFNSSTGLDISASNVTSKVNIKSDGIQLIKDSTHLAKVDSNGMQVFSGDATNDVASFGATARIGKTTGNHIVLDTNGLKLKSDATTTPLSIRFYRNSLTSLMSGEFECSGDTGAGHLKMNYLQTKTTSLLDAFYNDGSISKYAELFLRADSLNGGESEAKITADSITMNGRVACSGALTGAVQTPTGTLTATSGTIESYSARRFGQVITLYFGVKNASAVPAGQNLFTGTWSGPKPVVNSTGAGYIGGVSVPAIMNTSGTLTVRNASGYTIPANNAVGMSITFITAS